MEIGDLLPVAIAFVVGGIVLAFGAQILSQTGTNFYKANCNSTNTSGCNYDYNSTVQGSNALSNVATQLPLLGTVVIAAVVIGVLIHSFRE